MDDSYTHYVVTYDNEILSGWEYKSDALDDAKERRENGERCRVVPASYLRRKGLI